MDGKDGNGRGDAVDAGLLVARDGFPPLKDGIESARQYWPQSPMLSWITAEDGRLVHMTGSDPARTASASAQVQSPDSSLWPVAARHFAGRDPAVTAARYPAQSLETLAAADGTLRQILVLDFPVPGNGSGHLASVAIDITAVIQRLDELTHLTMIDELTSVYNRRGFFLLAEHELRAARRRRTRSAVCYIDIDGLKRINDTQGHDCGNRFILETVRILRREFRECDVIGRLGGDEFAVFTADVKGGPENLKQRLCKRLSFALAGSAARIRGSASIGVVGCEPEGDDTLADLLQAADRAMYQQKTAGTQPHA